MKRFSKWLRRTAGENWVHPAVRDTAAGRLEGLREARAQKDHARARARHGLARAA